MEKSLFTSIKFQHPKSEEFENNKNISQEFYVNVLSSYIDRRLASYGNSHIVAFVLIENCAYRRTELSKKGNPFQINLKNIRCVIGDDIHLATEVSRLGFLFKFWYRGRNFCQIMVRCTLDEEHLLHDLTTYKVSFQHLQSKADIGFFLRVRVFNIIVELTTVRLLSYTYG